MAKISRFLLESFLSSHFEIKKTSNDNEVRINSIFETDNKYHLYINLEKGLYTDFKTSTSGNVEMLISEYLNIPKKNVLFTLIENYAGGGTAKSMIEEIAKEAKEEKPTLVMPKGLKFFKNSREGLVRDRAYRYLKKRQIKEEVIQNELGYIYGGDSEFSGRVFIPFFENGSIVYFIARDFMGNKLRYKNPVGLDSKSFVYNIDKIKDEVVLCEGIFDALSLDSQVGVPMLSAHLGKVQIEKILGKEPKRIIIVPDSDETGERTLERNIELISRFSFPGSRPEVRVFNIPKPSKDLNEYKTFTGIGTIHFEECNRVDKKKNFFDFTRRKINIYAI